MAYGTTKVDVIQSSTAGLAPQFNDGNGTQTGTLCRAWVNFNGTGTVAIRASFNVSSITDNGTGDYTVNFTNALADANYCSQGTGQAPTGSDPVIASIKTGTTPTTSAINFRMSNDANTAIDPPIVNIAVFR